MRLKLQLKSGDTLALEGTVTVNGVPQNLTGWEIRSSVREGTDIIAQMLVTYIDRVNGMYSLRFDNTSSWLARRLFMDIKYISSSGQKMSTETITIEVIPGLTE